MNANHFLSIQQSKTTRKHTANTQQSATATTATKTTKQAKPENQQQKQTPRSSCAKQPFTSTNRKKQNNKAGGVGFEPTTPTLGG
jgi:hypothetical protein